MSLAALVLVGTCVPGQHQAAHRAHQQGGQPAARQADQPPPEPESTQHSGVVTKCSQVLLPGESLLALLDSYVIAKVLL